MIAVCLLCLACYGMIFFVEDFDTALKSAWFQLCDAVESVFFDDFCRVTVDGKKMVVSEIVFLKNFLTPNWNNVHKILEEGFEVDFSCCEKLVKSFFYAVVKMWHNSEWLANIAGVDDLIFFDKSLGNVA